MRTRTASALLLTTALTCLYFSAAVQCACDPDQMTNGCKITGLSCTCGFGCGTEYIYKTRRQCLNARGNTLNICSRPSCLRGICIQTRQDPGFTCICVGTGFYGERCEKACPTIPSGGLIFPHECIVI